ncbi:hypothetical protein K8S17_02735, partial [bacterium]|nr:hypothetical protein [bacterium]
MMMRERLIRTRPLAILVMFAALAICSAGCGGEELTERYRAEKMSWRVRTLELAMSENAELATDEMVAGVIERHREIISRFPPPAVVDETTPAEVVDVAGISAASRLSLASLLVGRATSENADEMLADAFELLESVRDEYAFDRDLAINAALRIAGLRELTGDWSGAIDELGGVLDTWGPTRSDRGDEPDVRILQVPRRRAAAYAIRGMADQAARVYAEAHATYSSWSGTWHG